MSVPGPGQASIVCPQCKLILPFNQTVCYNCGLALASPQSAIPLENAHIPLVNGSQFRGPQISSVSNLPFGSPQTSSLLSDTQWRSPQTPALLSGAQWEGPQTPVLLNSVQVSLLNGMQWEGPQTPAILDRVQMGNPQTVLPGSSPQARSVPISSTSARREKEPIKRATLIYFIAVILVIIIGTFMGLNAAGISLKTLTVQPGTSSSVLVYHVPKVVPLFVDSFVNDVSGWNLQSVAGNYGVTIGNGALTLAVEKHQMLWEPLPGAISYGNFTLTVDATLTKGDQNNGYGIYIRGAAGRNSDLATYYRFELYGDASYAIFKGTVAPDGRATATKLVNYTLSPVIQKQGRPNHIMIYANRGSMSLIVNGQLLRTIADSSYAMGSIALFASNLLEAKPGITVQFSKLALYPTQLSLPS